MIFSTLFAAAVVVVPVRPVIVPPRPVPVRPAPEPTRVVPAPVIVPPVSPRKEECKEKECKK